MDIAIFSTRIFTGNPAQPWAEALKITDEQITRVGSNAEIKEACGSNTERRSFSGHYPGCCADFGNYKGAHQ